MLWPQKLSKSKIIFLPPWWKVINDFVDWGWEGGGSNKSSMKIKNKFKKKVAWSLEKEWWPVEKGPKEQTVNRRAKNESVCRQKNVLRWDENRSKRTCPTWKAVLEQSRLSAPGGGALDRQADVCPSRQHLNEKLTHRASEAWWRHFWAKPKSLCSSLTSTRHLPDHKLLFEEIFPWGYKAPHINILSTWQSLHRLSGTDHSYMGICTVSHVFRIWTLR